MSAIGDLLNDIFDGPDSPLYAEFEGWARGSRRFRAFAATYRAKIRAKLKNARHEGGLDDLRVELETAALLLREERFTLEYEKYAALRQRSPDFSVTFKSRTPFNVEVRRIRAAETDGEDAAARANKLVSVLADKVGQMPPGIVNLLWLVPDIGISADDVAGAAATLRRAAERKDNEYFARHGFASAAEYLRQYARLSAVVLRHPAGNDLCLNTNARHPAPTAIVTAIRRIV